MVTQCPGLKKINNYHQDGILQIDKTDPVQGKASGRNKSLNIRGSTYIGGHPYMNRTGHIAATYKGLQGCVRNLRIRRKSIGLVEGVEPLVETTAGVVACSSHPCREGYCRNEGQCEVREWRKEVLCTCSKGFRGKRCHKRKGGTRESRGYRNNHRNNQRKPNTKKQLTMKRKFRRKNTRNRKQYKKQRNSNEKYS